MPSTCSGCPEAVKLLVGNKCDLPAEVDLQQAKVTTPMLLSYMYVVRFVPSITELFPLALQCHSGIHELIISCRCAIQPNTQAVSIIIIMKTWEGLGTSAKSQQSRYIHVVSSYCFTRIYNNDSNYCSYMCRDMLTYTTWSS